MPTARSEHGLVVYRNRLAAGQWRAEEYPPPPYRFPAGIETPRTLQRLTERLVQRGFAEIELQDLALNLDRADQNPNLVRRKTLRIGFRQAFQFLGHRGVLKQAVQGIDHGV